MNNAAEIKLDLHKRIDKLTASELNRVYTAFLSILESSESYALSKQEKKAIDEALYSDKNAERFTTDSVLKEAKQKYPNLKFK
ncbi:MAG TPA: hypothetical protein VHO90_08960 [Bacteroidales bacterium]|nr:hypothetical protein [Bacteroidales bacterium]